MGRRSDEPRGWQGTPRRRCSPAELRLRRGGVSSSRFCGVWMGEGREEETVVASKAERRWWGIELAKGARDARTHGAAREGWGSAFGREMWGCLGVWRPARRGRGRGRWERGGVAVAVDGWGVGIALPLLIYTTGCPGRGGGVWLEEIARRGTDRSVGFFGNFGCV